MQSLIERLKDDEDIKLSLPLNRVSGDSLRLIMEIAVITNWKMDKDDQLVQFLKNYSKIISQRQQQTRTVQRRTKELIKNREKQFNNLLAVKIPSILADLASKYQPIPSNNFEYKEQNPD